MSEGVRRIAAERQRQIEVKGWTPEHDDQHGGNELVEAGIAYAWSVVADGAARWWPPGWSESDFSGPPLPRLVKAGALIAAEIDRRLRAEAAEATRDDVALTLTPHTPTMKELAEALRAVLDGSVIAELNPAGLEDWSRAVGLVAAYDLVVERARG